VQPGGVWSSTAYSICVWHWRLKSCTVWRESVKERAVCVESQSRVFSSCSRKGCWYPSDCPSEPLCNATHGQKEEYLIHGQSSPWHLTVYSAVCTHVLIFRGCTVVFCAVAIWVPGCMSWHTAIVLTKGMGSLSVVCTLCAARYRVFGPRTPNMYVLSRLC
jgi:hypothetical protein